MTGCYRNMEIRGDKGMAYMAILGLLVILGTLGLAFAHKVGVDLSATSTRRTSIQAQYLAETAANHALWRIMNEPGFPVSKDLYYMHDLAGGRYGYKVRPPTPTTFATVATVGALGDHVVHQSYVQYLIPYDILLAYGRKDDTTPDYRRFMGANWSDPANTVDINKDPVRWMELEGCPTRKEILMCTLDDDNDINFAVWNGSSWGNHSELATGADKNYKCFDIAYETNSGDALVLWRFDGSSSVGLNIWTGSGWFFTLFLPSFPVFDGTLRTLVMESNPRSDEIMIGTVSSKDDLELFRWNGSSLSTLGMLEDDMFKTEFGTAEIVYEQQSGHAMILWGEDGNALIRYRVWNGSFLSAEGDLPDFKKESRIIRAAADPTSDYIVVAAVTDTDKLNVAVWNGNAWIDSREVDPIVLFNDRQILDVAWEKSGDEALVAWGSNSGSSQVSRYLTWSKGTVLADSAIQDGPDFGNKIHLVKLSPVARSDKIILLISNEDRDLKYSLWTGNRFFGDPAIPLDLDVEDRDHMPFDLAEADPGS